MSHLYDYHAVLHRRVSKATAGARRREKMTPVVPDCGEKVMSAVVALNRRRW